MTTFPAMAQQRACTEIGCQNGLMLSVDPERKWQPGNYEFSFLLDQRQVKCKGELPLKACENGPSFKCDDPRVRIGESGCALPKEAHALSDITIDGMPGRVMVRATHNGNSILMRTLRPAYQTSQPNGPGCAPVCRSASHDLFSAR